MSRKRCIGFVTVPVFLILVVGLLPGAAFQAQDDESPEPLYRSPIHVVVSADGLRAYVVNQTSNSVSVLDVSARAVVDEITVGSHPSHATLSADGRTLYVTSRYGAAIEEIDLAHRRVLRTIPTGFEPNGVALSADGADLYVVNSLSDTVSVIAVDTGETLHEIPVGRDPRFVVETPNSDHLIVTNSLSRGVSIIEAATGRLVETRRIGRASLMRDVVCTSDGRWAFVAHVISHDEQITLQMERGWIHSNGFSVLDLQSPGHYVTLLLDNLLVGAANPWGLALAPDGRHLYVSLAGVHEIAIVDVEKVLQLVAETTPEEVERLSQDVEIVTRRGIARRVGSGGNGPRGLALSAATGELLVANYFSDNVAVLDPRTGEVRAVIPLGPAQQMTLRRRGEMLFNDANLCFQKWFSCASCHQEGADVDGLNWDLANDGLGNPKNVKSLHDVGDTPPAMWGGVRKDIDAAVAAGQRFLGFLPEPENHRALVAYIQSSRQAPNPYRSRDPDALARGARVFRRGRCDICHPEPRFTDLKKHDLGLAAETDLRSRFDTPSLRECYRTAPYLHDGRATTLRKIFTEHNPDNLHGTTSHLSAQEFDDLLEYLRSL